MKSYLASVGMITLGFATPAIAADLSAKPDLPVKARSAPPAIATGWTGFYLGVHGGYGRGRNPFSDQFEGPDDQTTRIGGIDSHGWVFGGHAGHLWQYGSVVTGLELDFSAADIKGSTSATLSGSVESVTQTQQDRIKYLGSARARLGVLPADNVLLYGTGGLGWQRLDRTQAEQSTSPGPLATTTTETNAIDRFGWVAGAGVEMRLFGGNWLGRIEYLHYDFGRLDHTRQLNMQGGVVTSEFLVTSGRQTIDVVRAGLSYQFGAPTMSGATAMAAALPVKASPGGGAVASSWSGFYLGAHGGYGWGNSPVSETVSGPEDNDGILGGIRSRGGVLGAHAGHNWQYGRVVTGLEVDFSVADIRGSTSLALSSPDEITTITARDRIKYLGSVRARLGFLPTEGVLLYGTAGLGWQRLERTMQFDEIDSDGIASNETFVNPIDRFGWVAGAGAEARLFGSNWIGRIEYLHYDFGRFERSHDVQSQNGDVFFEERRTSGRQTIDVVRAGLSYKFGATPGIVAVAMAAGADAFGWSGFYIGAHGGYGFGNNPFSLPLEAPPGTSGSIGGIDSRGGVFGGHAGYNLRYGRMVAGLEVDFSATDIKGSTSGTLFNEDIGQTITTTLQDRIEYLGSVRARLGALATESVLLYATGGLGWERLERSTHVNNTTTATGLASLFSSAEPFDRFGWVAGAGAEARLFGSNWLGRIEYLHYDFGRADQSRELQMLGSAVIIDRRETSGRQTVDIVRAGLAYKFGPH